MRDGRDGRDGDTAYEIALRSGFVGSERDWLESLKGGKAGDRGIKGLPGEPGISGKDGARGVKGDKGDRGPEGQTGPAPAHEWKDTSLRFRQPDGDWGKLVDLQGPAGRAGEIRVVGGGAVGSAGSGSGATGPAGATGATGPAGADGAGLPEVFIDSGSGLPVTAYAAVGFQEAAGYPGLYDFMVNA